MIASSPHLQKKALARRVEKGRKIRWRLWQEDSKFYCSSGEIEEFNRPLNSHSSTALDSPRRTQGLLRQKLTCTH